eukprot:382543-Pleurochrysis_carterae.AAC.2
MVKHFGGDVGAGLRQLLPAQDWSFLGERQKRTRAQLPACSESARVPRLCSGRVGSLGADVEDR